MPLCLCVSYYYTLQQTIILNLAILEKDKLLAHYNTPSAYASTPLSRGDYTAYFLTRSLYLIIENKKSLAHLWYDCKYREHILFVPKLK